MFGSRVEINGTKKAILSVNTLADIKWLDAPTKRWSGELHRNDIYGRQNYVPERPGQTYVRTGDLGAGHTLSHPFIASARFQNLMDYDHWVVGNTEGGGQAWMHRNRWWTVYQKVESAIPELLKLSSEEAIKIWG